MKKKMISTVWLCVSSLLLLFAAETSAQAPSLTAFDVKSNQTHRTNVCDRFLEYANGDVDIRDALKGLNLTVGVVDQLNDVYIRFNQQDGTINETDPGIFVIILDELARRGQFNWRNNFARVLPPNGSNPDTGLAYNWTDVLYEAVWNYDFSFAEWVHNQERRVRGISFPVGWYDASTILVQNKVEDVVTFDVTAFLKPFSNEVWAMIVGVFIVSGLLYWLIDKIANWGTDNEVNSILYDMFLATMTFTQHHMYWDPSGHGKRIFAFSASFWSLVLASAYTANLASFLVSQGQPAEIATSLAEVEARELSLCVRANSALEADLKLRYPRMALKSGADFSTIYGNLLNGECDLVATRPFDFDQFKNNIDINPNCTLEWIGRQDNVNKGGAATLVDTRSYCTSLITHVLEIHMNEMLDDHFIDLTWQAHLRNQSSHQCGANEAEGEIEQQALTIKEVGGIFVFHAALGLISIVVALAELWWNRRQERQEMMLMGGNDTNVDGSTKESAQDPGANNRRSMDMSAMSHYQSSMALQSIINDRAGQRKGTRPSLLQPSPQEQDHHVDFGEDVMITISALQSEMEKLQNYVVEKRNKNNGEGTEGA